MLRNREAPEQGSTGTGKLRNRGCSELRKVCPGLGISLHLRGCESASTPGALPSHSNCYRCSVDASTARPVGRFGVYLGLVNSSMRRAKL